MSVFANVSGAVLLGGRSSRMGEDKARLTVGGEVTLLRLSNLLHGLFEEVLLVGGSPCVEARGRRVADPPGETSSLRGLVAALEAATRERVFVVATDLPLLTPESVLGLVAWPRAQVVAPRTEAGSHPFCAIYERESVLVKARANWQAGKLSLRALLDELQTAYLEASDWQSLDPDGMALRNMNTPADRAEIEAWLARRAAL